MNHSYLLSVDRQGRFDWSKYGYSEWIAEAESRSGISMAQLSATNDWQKLGLIGRGLGLHLWNAAFHRALDSNDVTVAKNVLRNRFELAKDWDIAAATPTTWNQYNQIAGQCLFVDDPALALDILDFAAARAGRGEIARSADTRILPNLEARRMEPYALEWLLHLMLRDQAEGNVCPDMKEGEGSLRDIKTRLMRMSEPPRFRRIADLILCRIYPEIGGLRKTDGVYTVMGDGTGIFLPRAPQEFPLGA